MKFVKFGILALSMGLFVASCGNNAEENAATTDTTTVAPAPEAAPVVTDSAAAPVADSAAAPAADTAAAAPAAH